MYQKLEINWNIIRISSHGIIFEKVPETVTPDTINFGPKEFVGI